MRIAVTLNGSAKHVAAIAGAGFLSAHLNLADRPKDGHVKRVLRVEGFDTNSDTETVSVKWPEIVLSPGDVVQLQVSDEGPADDPVSRRSTTESPANLFSNEELAREVPSRCEEFERHLFELMKKAENIETTEEHLKFKRAIGNVVTDLGDHLLRPVWRRHPNLVPDSMRGELL
jgi:hypothetical protein